MSNQKMSFKVKGLFRGLRFITQIFDKGKNKEQEDDVIQIGAPTDVKHVAHIGLDGPTATAPTWMDGFKNGAPAPQQPTPALVPKPPAKTQGDSNTKDSKHKTRLIPKSRNGSSESNVTDSPSRESSDGSKHRRRKSRNSNLGQESPATGSKNRIRRKKKSGSMDDSERSSTKGDSITDIDLGENGHHRRKNSDY